MSASQEIAKLTATWINNLSAAVLVAGVIAPTAAIKDPLENANITLTFAGSVMLWLTSGYFLHVLGRAWLEARYKE